METIAPVQESAEPESRDETEGQNADSGSASDEVEDQGATETARKERQTMMTTTKTPDELSDELGWARAAEEPRDRSMVYRLPTKEEVDEWWRTKVQKLAPTPGKAANAPK